MGLKVAQAKTKEEPARGRGDPVVRKSTRVSEPSLVESLLGLQRSHGNRFVQRILSQGGDSDAGPVVTPALADSIGRARSSGEPVDVQAREQMEGVFGTNFGAVRVHTGAAADKLSRALNARAFTTAQDIFFRDGEYNPASSSGLGLLAHELTHVVQQRGAGVPSKLETSQPDDPSEREADGVAAVVAQHLSPSSSAKRGQGNPAGIPEGISSGTAMLSLARRTIRRKAKSAGAEETDSVSTSVLYAAADVLQHQRLTGRADVDPKYQDVVRELYSAVVGTSDRKPLSGAKRLDMLSGALGRLRPAFVAFERDSDQSAWLASEVTPYIDRLRDHLNLLVAGERVERAQIGEGDKIIEVPEGDPHAEAAALHAKVSTLVRTLAMLNEQAIRIGHDTIHHVAEHMQEGHLPPQVKGKWGDPGMLVALQNTLFIVDGALTLADPELAHELAHNHGFWGGAANAVELVKAATEIVGGVLGTTFSFAAVVSKASNQMEYAAQAAGYARTIGLGLSNIVAGIEIAHGIAVLLDSHSTSEQKDDAIKDIAVGSAWFIGSRIGGAALGGPASVATMITFYEMKFMARLYGEARTGIVGGWMSKAYETMGEAAETVGSTGKQLTKAAMLLSLEKRPEQVAALGTVQRQHATNLGRSIDLFLDDCKPVGYGAGVAYKPGAFLTLRRQFEPLLRLQGATTPEATSAAAVAVIERINWCIEHARELMGEESGYPVEKAEPEEKKEGGG